MESNFLNSIISSDSLVVGEICIYGSGVARGYLRDADEENNIYANFTSVDHLRIYKTGDLARRLIPTGPYIFLGRKDAQLKILGIRVDPIEISINIRKILIDSPYNMIIGHICVKMEYLKNNSPVLVAYLEIDRMNKNINLEFDKKFIQKLTNKLQVIISIKIQNIFSVCNFLIKAIHNKRHFLNFFANFFIYY